MFDNHLQTMTQRLISILKCNVIGESSYQWISAILKIFNLPMFKAAVFLLYCYLRCKGLLSKFLEKPQVLSFGLIAIRLFPCTGISLLSAVILSTGQFRKTLSKLRSIFFRIKPEKQLISRLVPALWVYLKLHNRFVNFYRIITVITWLLLSNHQLTSPE